MHSLEEVRAEYDRLDRLCGVDTSRIELKISKRAVKQLGSFRCPRRGGKDGLCITLSHLILEDDEQFWDTVRHEYAHAAVYLLNPGERHGHDRVWKDMCRRIGCSPERLAPEKGQAAESRRGSKVYHPLRRLRQREPLYAPGQGGRPAAARARPGAALHRLRREQLQALCQKIIGLTAARIGDIL